MTVPEAERQSVLSHLLDRVQQTGADYASALSMRDEFGMANAAHERAFAATMLAEFMIEYRAEIEFTVKPEAGVPDDKWRVDKYTLHRGNFEAKLTRAWSSPTKMFWIWTIASHNGEGPWLAHDSADTLEKAQEAVKTWLKEHPDG